MSVHFDLVPQSKITFCDRNYILWGDIFHYSEITLTSYYIAVVKKKEKKKKHWFKASFYDTSVYGQGINVADSMFC